MGRSAMSAHRDRGRARGEFTLGGPVLNGRRKVRWIGDDAHGIRNRCVRQWDSFTRSGLDDAFGAPAHAEIGLDRSRVPELTDDVASDRRVLTLRCDDRVDVGRRAADVDDEDIAADDLGEHLDASEDYVRRGGEDHVGEGPALGQTLPADDVVEEGRPDRGAGAGRRDLPDSGDDIGGELVPATCGGENPAHLIGCIGVASDDDRCLDPGTGQAVGVVEEHCRVAAIGATDQQNEVGSGIAQGTHFRSRQLSRAHLDDSSTG